MQWQTLCEALVFMDKRKLLEQFGLSDLAACITQTDSNMRPLAELQLVKHASFGGALFGSVNPYFVRPDRKGTKSSDSTMLVVLRGVTPHPRYPDGDRGTGWPLLPPTAGQTPLQLGCLRVRHLMRVTPRQGDVTVVALGVVHLCAIEGDADGSTVGYTAYAEASENRLPEIPSVLPFATGYSPLPKAVPLTSVICPVACSNDVAVTCMKSG
jgi:hypothetical protein